MVVNGFRRGGGSELAGRCVLLGSEGCRTVEDVLLCLCVRRRITSTATLAGVEPRMDGVTIITVPLLDEMTVTMSA